MQFPQPETPPTPPGPSRRYCLITPCRDEAAYAKVTLDCVAAQTLKPTLWVIVDDGSTDRTPAILAEFAAKHGDWVKIITRPAGGPRRVGPGVIDAFYAGYDSIDPHQFDYVCKFDLDLDLPPAYFERMVDRMEADPRLATVSGKPYMKLGDKLVSEKCGDENSVGMIKFYRVSAFEKIGGFVRQVMWDGIDGHRCRMLGWRAASSDDPETRFVHLRPMGTSHKSWWTGRVRHGFGQYFMGTGPAYMLVSCGFRVLHPPMVLGSAAMFWGWLRSAMTRTPQYDDPAFRKYLRKFQWASLLGGKARAVKALDDAGRTHWTP